MSVCLCILYTYLNRESITTKVGTHIINKQKREYTTSPSFVWELIQVNRYKVINLILINCKSKIVF